MTQVALYKRVSSEEQAQGGVSLEDQETRLRQYAQAKGWQVVEVYSDPGYSGGTDQRPGFQRLMLDAKRHRFDVVAVTKLDRFMRNQRLLLNWLEELKKAGVHFVAVDENVDTSNTNGNLALQVLGTIAEWERGRISERTKDARRALIRQGRWPNGRTCYGYRWDNVKGEFETVEAEAEVVRTIYNWYVIDHLSMFAIAERLNTEGHRTRWGTHFGPDKLSTLIRHPAYKGEAPPFRYPPIVDKATWEAAQRQRGQARRIRQQPRQWMLQGLIVCERYGHTLACEQTNPRSHRYYGCNGRRADKHLDGSPRCDLPRIRADWLEKAAWDTFQRTVNDHDLLRESVSAALHELEARRKSMGRSDVENQLVKVQERLERLVEAYIDGKITKERYKVRLDQLESQKKELVARRANLDPHDALETARLEEYVERIRGYLDQGWLYLKDDGVWLEGPAPYPEQVEYLGAAGLDPNSAQKRLGQVKPKRVVQIGDGDVIEMSPTALWAFEHPREAEALSKRAALTEFSVKMFLDANRVTLRGHLPEQQIAMLRAATLRRGRMLGSIRTSSAIPALRLGSIAGISQPREGIGSAIPANFLHRQHVLDGLAAPRACPCSANSYFD